jgi:hypothetical protein
MLTKDLIVCTSISMVLTLRKTYEDFGCYLFTSYLENVCGVDVAEPKTPRR